MTRSNGYGGYAVLTSSSPAGPFTLRNKQMNITRLCPGPFATAPCGEAQGGAGDFDVFVDVRPDGRAEAYILYGANYYMSIEKLTDDFLYSTGQNASCGGKFDGTVYPEYFVEAPAMFKRKDLYYALFGHCCCFCYQGSGVIVHTASHPMGPWTVQSGGDIACVQQSSADSSTLYRYGDIAAVPTPGQGCLYNGSTDVSVTRSQQNFVISVPTSCASGDVRDDCFEYIWTGDRWQQSPDGLKVRAGELNRFRLYSDCL